VDVSGSVDDTRFRLPREATVAALLSDEFAAALFGGVNRTIEVAVVELAEESESSCPGPFATVVNQLRCRAVMASYKD
jgi:hypothetical protein